METIMHATDFEPGITGRGDPRQRDGTPQNEAGRRAGTPTTRESSIDMAIDGRQDTRNRPQLQLYPVRWLALHYGLSSPFAAVIAAELGIGGAA